MPLYSAMTPQDQNSLQTLNRQMRQAARMFAQAPDTVEAVVDAYDALTAAGLVLPDGSYMTASGDAMTKADMAAMKQFVIDFRAWLAVNGHDALLNRYKLG